MKAVIFNVLLLISMVSCGQEKTKLVKKTTDSVPEFTNQLIHESSPYLLQHAHNPVNWHPWNEKTLAKAKAENKLLVISIGYSACHWCHVMEEESFESIEVADYMNEHFISVKIDREERPDVDQVYMNAVQLLTGSGGWPLNVVAFPDGRPIYGGTYFPKKEWLSMLKQISEFVKEHPEKAEKQAQALTEGVKSNALPISNTKAASFKTIDLDAIFNFWKREFDLSYGGTKGAPKFPLPIGYQFLLHYHFLTQNKIALQAVTTTLVKMADGGIYDQIGGGFARYATDEQWRVPHFEKMLYDNAQLVSLYSKAYQATQNPYYKTIVYETLDFIKREMTSSEGAFYSSLDADSEGEEGKYYVWKKSELRALLGQDAELIADYYTVTEKGNWEHGTNILFKSQSINRLSQKYKISERELQEKIGQSKRLLLRERAKRVRPATDDKVLTAWNALMVKGYADAYRVFDEGTYLEAAVKNAEFLLKHLKKGDHRLDRNFKNNASSINGFLDDYAFSIDAFVALYQATFDEKWLNEAQHLTAYTLSHFYDVGTGMLYYTSDLDPSLFARKIEITDNVIPSANSQMAKNLFVLGQYFYNDDYILKSKKMLHNVKNNIVKGGEFYANWDILLAWFANEPYEVAIVGPEFLGKRKEMDKYYLPTVLLSGGKKEGSLALLKNKYIPGQTTIYVCQNKVCKRPETEVDAVISWILK